MRRISFIPSMIAEQGAEKIKQIRVFTNVILENLWCLFFVSVPFSVFGFRYKTYDFSIPTIVILSIAVICIIRGIYKKSFLPLYLYLLYVFISSSLLFIFKEYNSFPSLLILFLLLIPIIASYGDFNVRRVKKFIVIGLYLSLLLYLYEFFSVLFGMPDYIVSSPISLKSVSAQLVGFPRVGGGFQEPSWFALYLFNCFLYFKMNYPDDRIKIALMILFILFSTSLAGILLLFVYFSAELLQKKRFKFVIIAVGAVIVILSTNISNKLLDYYYNKISKTYNSIGKMEYNTSEALRINAFLVGTKYITDSETSFFNLAFGEGYAFQQFWIKNKFKGYINEFGRGLVTNLLAVTVISLGLIGFLLFLLMNYSMSRYFYNRETFVYFLVYLSSLGFLIFFLTWHLFYLGLFKVNNKSNAEESKNISL